MDYFALKKSSNFKNKLHKYWHSSRRIDDDIKYKQNRNFFKETAAAEKSYYQEMFDTKINSVKQLWHNLNEVCSFKSSIRSKSCNIPKIVNNNNVFFKPKNISYELNQYFSITGEKLVKNLGNSDKNDCSFESYCKNFVKHSMFRVPTELLKLINNLKDRKSSGADNAGHEIIEKAAVVIVEPRVLIYKFV
jgi:hypothetical protein